MNDSKTDSDSTAPPLAVSEKSPVPFSLTSGQPGRVLFFSPRKIVIETPEPSPPGSTVRGRLTGLQVELQVKVHNCQKQAESGLFVITGRTQNATREINAVLSGAPVPH